MESTRPRIVLATESRYKKELFSQLRIHFESNAAHIDESRRPGEAPADMARRLALEKAQAIFAEDPTSWVIGADQVIFLDDEAFSKPGSAEAAVEQLLKLQGRTHTLLSAIALVGPGGVWSAEAPFEMTMRSFSRAELERYVEVDQPLDCAGAYKVEAAGIRLFERMRGDDFTSIIGLPLTSVIDVLESAGLWSQVKYEL